MNAIDLLSWICSQSISGEDISIIEVPEEGDEPWEQNEEWWNYQFGNYPPYPAPEGKYLYLWGNVVDSSLLGNPDVQIEVPDEHGFSYINLYRIEE